MALHRRTFVHGILALPAGGLLADRALIGLAATVHNGAELQAALRVAGRGSVITLVPGDFGDVPRFELATPDVTLRAGVPLRSVLRAPLVVDGAGARLLDLAFLGEDEDNVHLVAATARACPDALAITARDVEVAGCDFGFFRARAILVRPTGLRPHIHDCSFHDNRDGGHDSNAHEAISLGYDNPTSSTSMRARVTGNRMWNLNVEGEAISVKTSDNVVQGNRISSSRAGFTNRYGERNLFEGNTTTNSRGFAVSDRGTRLVRNTVNGRGSIRVLAGNASYDARVNGVHCQATDTYLEGNSGPLLIGHTQSGTKPAVGTTVKSHNGRITLIRQTGTKLPGRV